jgi:hypothetical protein
VELGALQTPDLICNSAIIPMPDTKAGRSEGWSDAPLLSEDPRHLARHLIDRFGAAAAGKAFEKVREATDAKNRKAALKWHKVMSLIEQTKRNP